MKWFSIALVLMGACGGADTEIEIPDLASHVVIIAPRPPLPVCLGLPDAGSRAVVPK